MSIEDKAFWLAVADDHYRVPSGFDVSVLVRDLVSYLSSPDPVFRDDIAYTTLAHWIVHNPQVPPDVLRQMQARLLGGLMHNIGETGTDSVFQRSFSMLIIGLIVCHDNEDPFLTAEEVKMLLFATLEYLAAERDPRGYVPEKGWAHALAHTADALKFLARNPNLDALAHLQILQGVQNKLTTPTDHIYVHDEDERLGLMTLEIIARDLLPVEDLIDWVQQLVMWKRDNPKDLQFDPIVFGTHQNIKHFLRSLYFQLAKLEKSPVSAAYEETLRMFKAIVWKATTAYNF